MAFLDSIGGLFSGGLGGFAGRALGTSTSGMFDPYQAPNEQMRQQGLAYNGIDASVLNQQAQVAGQQQRQQNIAGYNSAVASQRGVNPTLAAAAMGNNLSAVNAQTGANTQNIQAQNAWQAQQANQNMLQNYYTQQSQNYNTAHGANLNAESASADRAQKGLGNVIGGAANFASGAISSIFSDERMKQPVDPIRHAHQSHMFGGQEKSQMADAGHTSAESFMQSLAPQSFEYKGNSAADDGAKPHLGVMAQDLEKTPEGASAVQNTPEGKTVDTNQLAMMVAAAMGELHHRVSQLEGRRAA